MFREMRRKQQQLSREETLEILNTCTSGVLGVSGDDGYPYTVPLSYAVSGDTLYFHCAKTGHKIDGLARNDKVTFCVIAQDEVIPQAFATHYRSVIVFGRARIVTEDAERRHGLECLAAKYSPGYFSEGQQEIEKDWNRVCVVALKIEHMSGKAAKDLIDQGA